MPSHQSAVSTLIREVLADPDLAHDEVFRRLLQAGLQDLVDAEAAAVIGAQRYERTPHRTNRRNGTRPKTVATTAGEVELAIPKLRTGSFFPSLLHPRRRVDKALYSVICSAWIEGVSTRKAWRPRQGPGQRVRHQPLHGLKDLQGHRRGRARVPVPPPGPHLVPLRLRGRHLPGRESGAPGGLPGAGGGHRRVGPGPPGDPGHGPGRRRDGRLLDVLVLRSLRERGLKVPSPHDPEGVVLVTSDAHAGIRAAVRAILPGASWQRCRVHFARNITSRLGPARSKPAGALVSTIFAQTSREAVAAQYKHVIDSLKDAFPEIAQMLKDAEPDLTAFAAFPREHWTKIWSNNPIERLNREIKRRADVVQVFPDSESVTRLIGSVLLEQHEEWQYGERRYLSQTSLQRLTDMLHTDNSTGGRPALLAITT